MPAEDREESRISRALDRAHDWATRLAALGLVFLVGWGVVRLTIGETREGVRDFLATVEANWKACLLFVVVMFYRPIRGFLERLEEFGGAKAPQKPKPQKMEQQADTPRAGAGDSTEQSRRGS